MTTRDGESEMSMGKKAVPGVRRGSAPSTNRRRDSASERLLRDAVNERFDLLLVDLEKLIAHVPPSLQGTASTLRVHFKRAVAERRIKPGEMAAWSDEASQRVCAGLGTKSSTS